MNKLHTIGALLLSAITISACSTTTPYQPLRNGYGYSDQKLESNRYRISFSGNSSTPRDTVENYLLYRAAELTLQSGNDYFVLVDNSTEADTRYRQSINAYSGFGHYYWYPSVAVSSGDSYPITSYEASANIQVFSGEKPADNPQAFDARDVRANLQPLVTLPSE
ncbi:hypothetical protein RM530_09935 [Algiphilus sp. W345]|uniref:Lipoprotein n=1 Tax=Banduia mediterranea TaxID=3075609 RepID=A0ABU2WIJ7_9GAMM|nr:hypothetical protein [Algiphilus sp. W345]MDT0497681.1 hypothetical protein [Algiphilus sp. W345]